MGAFGGKKSSVNPQLQYNFDKNLILLVAKNVFSTLSIKMKHEMSLLTSLPMDFELFPTLKLATSRRKDGTKTSTSPT